MGARSKRFNFKTFHIDPIPAFYLSITGSPARYNSNSKFYKIEGMVTVTCLGQLDDNLEASLVQNMEE